METSAAEHREVAWILSQNLEPAAKVAVFGQGYRRFEEAVLERSFTFEGQENFNENDGRQRVRLTQITEHTRCSQTLQLVDLLCDVYNCSLNAVVLNFCTQNVSKVETNRIVEAAMDKLKLGGFLLLRHDFTFDNIDYQIQKFNKAFLGYGCDSTQECTFLWMKNMVSSLKNCSSHVDVLFLLRKDQQNGPASPHLSAMYENELLAAWEWAYSEGGRYQNWINYGGPVVNMEYLKILKLNPESNVLDFGCGSGGNAFQIAQNYGADVTGLDSCSSCIASCLATASRLKTASVQFILQDGNDYEFKSDVFDVIFSMAAPLLFSSQEQKAKFMQLFKKSLKPGGRVIINEFALPEGPLDPDAETYIKFRKFGTPFTQQQMQTKLVEAGFKDVVIMDETHRYTLKHCHLEQEALIKNKTEFVERFSTEIYDDFCDTWRERIKLFSSNKLQWVTAIATA